jgi:ACS family hexuronate transporter-like MFS transporter
MIARLVTDPVWWFYLYWAPKFLNSRFGLQLDQLGLPLVVIYLCSDAGSIFGGWLSSRLIGRGWTANAARKTAILVCAAMVLPIAAAPHTDAPWLAVALLSLATAGHQGWAANIFTIVSDMVPARAVSSAVGLSGFGGSVGGMMAASAIGFLLEATHSYALIFLLASVSYFAALGLVHVASPRLAPIQLEDRPQP